ncbi:MAG: hypothetical protein L6Q37_06030 [Bdellovibrionaceae bacterium]|nr:hypothetical protein [Pseudobdellovibrionaceae bacterium]NUM59421.1 VWA domain-containing protein [Pseudobdellovibrionaceae bacterium]
MKFIYVIFSFLLLNLFLISCGPVKFSSSSNTEATGTGTDTTQGTGTGNGTDNNNNSTTSTKNVKTTYTVTSQQNKVDIILILDNSSSMAEDNSKLASRLTTFVSQLESSAIDWQMCMTVTSYIPYNGSNYWGMSINWSDYNGSKRWLLNKGTSNLSTIFQNTINNNLATGGSGTNDERGIKAAYWHVNYKDYNSCYRNGAALAYIFISDEDERSIGGKESEKYYSDETTLLEQDDLPSSLVDKIKASLGNNIRLRANSIIVKPEDSNCLQTQDNQGTKAHYGTLYKELSTLTGGGVGSICDTDYANNLNYFNEVINDSLSSMALECNPVGNNVSVTITPTNSAITSTVQGQSLVFNPSVPSGSTIVAEYKCAISTNNRLPNSVPEEISILSKLYTWIVAPILGLFK